MSFSVSLTEDLKRRDFTINAMAHHPHRGLVDPFGGEADIKSGLLRAVGDPDERFSEDALRILRAMRFASTFGMRIDPQTKAAMDRLSDRLALVSKERVGAELTKIVTGRYAKEVLMSCRDVLAKVIPEIKPCFAFEQHNPYHIYDVWEHTAVSVGAAPQDPVIRLTMLFHDLGKPERFTRDDNGVGHFIGHWTASRLIAEAALERLRYSRDTIKTVAELVEYHDYRFGASTRSVRRFLNKVDKEQAKRYFAVRRADIAAQSPQFKTDSLKEVAEQEKLMDDILSQEQCFSLKDLAVNGNDMMALGFSGPRIGAVLKELLEMVMDDQGLNTKEHLTAAAEAVLNRNN